MNPTNRDVSHWARAVLRSGMALLQLAWMVAVGLRAEDPIPQFLSIVPTQPDGVPPKECGANGRLQVVPAAQCLSQDLFQITLPSESVVTVVRDRWEDLGGGDGVWCGHVDGEPLSRVTIASRRGVLSAVLDRPLDSGNEVAELSPTAAGVYLWYQRDDSVIPTCLPAPPTPGSAAGQSSSIPPSIALDAVADPIVIDIMVVYSTASRNRYGQAGIEAKILQAVSDANTAFANSLVNAQYNLAYLGEVAYTETGSMYTSLDALVLKTDGVIDGVHAIRDSVSADLVCMITEDTDSCGLSYVMTTVDTSFAPAAFSVVYSGCLASLSMSHEFGHNAGCQHDREDAGFPGAYPYSYGWRNCATDGTGYRTVMSYPCNGVPRLAYFSNPNLIYMGSPMGVDYELDPLHAADNARTFNQTASVVSAFRVTGGSAPSAPSSLSAAAPAFNRVELSWVDTAANETTYAVERSTDGSIWLSIAFLAADSVQYSDTSVSPATTYYYRVQASNTAGVSAYSNLAQATTPLEPLGAPGNLTAIAVSSSRIDLTWVDNAGAETAYYVESSTDNLSFTTIAILAADSIAHSATGLPTSATRYFRVRAGDGVAYSPYSATVVATTLPLPPKAPSSLAVKLVSTSQIKLAWRDNASNEAAYFVERSTDGVVYTVVASVGSNVTSYTDEGLASGTKYFYRVRAWNLGGYSAYSSVVSATTRIPVPNPPSSLSLNVVSKSQIDLSWVDNATNESAFKIERSKNGTSWSQIATVGANVTGYKSTSLSANTLYYYRVRASNASGNSGYSNVASARTLAQ